MSLHIGETTVDHEAARRCIFAAQQADEHNARAWERRCTAELADPSPTPQPKKSEWKSRPLAGCAEQAATISGGTVHRISDEETAQFAPVAATQSGKFHARVESVLQEICRDETGQFETAEETKTRLEKEQRLKEQGSIICDALERVGVQGFRADAWQLWAMGIHSHEYTEIPAFRRICLNPYVAHRLRMPYLNWLQYFAQGREQSLRFWTFTSGERCTSRELEARIKTLHRRISELNNEPWMIDAGVRIIFRATEFGTLETDKPDDPANDGETGGGIFRDAEGRWWYHPHAHCIVWLSKGKLPAWQWKALLERVWRFWGHNWDEGARIRNMREAVKYVVKPGDMVRLAEEDPQELKRLSEILFRKKLVQPMGELLLQKRAADIAGLMPALRWHCDGEKTVQKWRLIADPNRNRLADGAEGAGVKDCNGNEMSNTSAERYLRRNHDGVKPQDLQVCRVVARTSPAFNTKGIKEPRVIVMGSFFDKDAILKHPLVRRMVSATKTAYSEGVRAQASDRAGRSRWVSGGSDIRVHTGTPTVPAFDPPTEHWEPDEASEPDIWHRSEAILANN
jgi:hypothetical protein